MLLSILIALVLIFLIHRLLLTGSSISVETLLLILVVLILAYRM